MTPPPLCGYTRTAPDTTRKKSTVFRIHLISANLLKVAICYQSLTRHRVALIISSNMRAVSTVCNEELQKPPRRWRELPPGADHGKELPLEKGQPLDFNLP